MAPENSSAATETPRQLYTDMTVKRLRARIASECDAVRRYMDAIERGIARGDAPTGEAPNAANALGRLAEDIGALGALIEMSKVP